MILAKHVQLQSCRARPPQTFPKGPSFLHFTSIATILDEHFFILQDSSRKVNTIRPAFRCYLAILDFFNKASMRVHKKVYSLILACTHASVKRRCIYFIYLFIYLFDTRNEKHVLPGHVLTEKFQSLIRDFGPYT